MEAAIQSLVDFMVAHSAWAFWIALGLTTAENIAFLSVLVHATPILIGVGAVAATGQIDFTPIFLGAALGSIIGATISWFLGIRYGERILAMQMFAKRPELVARGKAALDKWGAAGIVIGHFFFALRPVIFLMCGMARMPFRVFMLWNVIGSVAWAYLVPKFGEVTGLVIGWVWRLFTGG
jgi:membrane protein DedA with SNARE-associated domain